MLVHLYMCLYMYMFTWRGRRSRIWSEGYMCLCAMFKKMGLPPWHGLLRLKWACAYVPCWKDEPASVARPFVLFVLVWKAPSLDWVALDCILGDDQHCIYIYIYIYCTGCTSYIDVITYFVTCVSLTGFAEYGFAEYCIWPSMATKELWIAWLQARLPHGHSVS